MLHDRAGTNYSPGTLSRVVVMNRPTGCSQPAYLPWKRIGYLFAIAGIWSLACSLYVVLCSSSAKWWGLSVLLIVCCGSISKTLLAADEERLRLFQDSLDAVRRQYRIPGLSAAIVKNQQIIWEKGYGYADIANGVAAQPDTPYLIASLISTHSGASSSAPGKAYRSTQCIW